MRGLLCKRYILSWCEKAAESLDMFRGETGCGQEVMS